MFFASNGTPSRPWRQLTGVAFAALGLLSLSLLTVSGAKAQAQPPDRFYGVVTVNGKHQPVGTVVDAYVGDTLCGAGSVQERAGNVIYFVDVLGGGQKPGCAKDGDTVTFKVSGLSAKEKGTYQTGTATHLDLTASGTPQQEATQTVLPPGGGGTPAPPPPTPTPATPAVGTSAPPRPGATSTATPPTPGSAATPAKTPSAAGATASSTPARTAAGTAAVSSTPFGGQSVSEAASATPQTPASAPPLIKRSKSSGVPAWVWVVIAVAGLAAIGGIAAWFYRQRTAA